MSDYKYTHKRKDLSKSKVQISYKVDASAIEKAKDKAYQKVAKDVDIKGFRPGQAPRHMVESTLGSRFFEEAVNVLLPAVAQDALKKENIMPIAPLQYDLTKFAEGSDLEFNTIVYVLPPFDLKKLKKIKVKKGDIKVAPKEVKSVIDNMYKDSKAKEAEAKKEGLEIAGEDKRQKSTPKKDEGKPTDEWTKSLNLAVNSLKELEEKVTKELEYQKKYYVEQKFQYSILEEAMKLSDAEVPEPTLEHEIEHRMERFLEDLLKLEMTLEKYMAANKTTEEKIKKEWQEEISKSIMAELVLEQIARAADIKVSEAEIQAEIDKIQDPKLRERYDSSNGRADIMMGLRKNKALHELFHTADPDHVHEHDHADHENSEKKAKKPKSKK
jgi:trigger factor